MHSTQLLLSSYQDVMMIPIVHRVGDDKNSLYPWSALFTKLFCTQSAANVQPIWFEVYQEANHKMGLDCKTFLGEWARGGKRLWHRSHVCRMKGKKIGLSMVSIGFFSSGKPRRGYWYKLQGHNWCSPSFSFTIHFEFPLSSVITLAGCGNYCLCDSNLQLKDSEPLAVIPCSAWC